MVNTNSGQVLLTEAEASHQPGCPSKVASDESGTTVPENRFVGPLSPGRY